MQRAIVTGAAGFIGYHLVKELLQQGYEVLAVVHSSAGMRKIEALQNERIDAVICEIPDFQNLFGKAFGTYDVFFHMAWCGVFGVASRNCDIQLRNIEGAISAVRTAGKLQCKRFLGAGSIHEIECIREVEKDGPPLNFVNYYKSAKLSAHYFCKLEATAQGLDFLWPRLTNTYGVGEVSERLINSTVRKLIAGESPIFTEASQLYNFIYISDAVRAYRLLAERGVSYREYILGSEEVLPLKKYLLDIQKIVNPGVKMRFGEYPFKGIFLNRNELHSDAFFLDTGFQTNVNFSEGIRRVMDYIQKESAEVGRIQCEIENHNGCYPNLK